MRAYFYTYMPIWMCVSSIHPRAYLQRDLRVQPRGGLVQEDDCVRVRCGWFANEMRRQRGKASVSSAPRPAPHAPSGSWTISTPMLRRRAWPPEMPLTMWEPTTTSATSSRPSMRITSSARSLRLAGGVCSSRRSSAAYSSVSRTVKREMCTLSYVAWKRGRPL